MKRAVKIAAGIGMAATLGWAAATAIAQPYGYGPGWRGEAGPGYGMGWGHGMGRGMGPMMGHGMGPMGRGMGPGAFGNPVAAAEGRLAYLKSELKITSDQESAWQAYADQVKRQAETRQGWQTSAPQAVPASAPERLALRTEQIKKRADEMEKITGAFKNLYAALTPEQKTLADRGFGGFGGGWHGGPGRRFR